MGRVLRKGVTLPRVDPIAPEKNGAVKVVKLILPNSCRSTPMPWPNEAPRSKSSPTRGNPYIEASTLTRSGDCALWQSVTFAN